VLDAQGKYAEAEVEYRRALALREKALGPEHPAVATSYYDLSLVFAGQGKTGEALLHLESAWRVVSTARVPPAEKAQTAFALAKLLRQHRAHRRRAVDLAKRALRAYADAGSAEEHREVQRWLKKHSHAH
jgi:tetratricopeptide (TPR) repeat protein